MKTAIVVLFTLSCACASQTQFKPTTYIGADDYKILYIAAKDCPSTPVESTFLKNTLAAAREAKADVNGPILDVQAHKILTDTGHSNDLHIRFKYQDIEYLILAREHYARARTPPDPGVMIYETSTSGRVVMDDFTGSGCVENGYGIEEHNMNDKKMVNLETDGLVHHPFWQAHYALAIQALAAVLKKK